MKLELERKRKPFIGKTNKQNKKEQENNERDLMN